MHIIDEDIVALPGVAIVGRLAGDSKLAEQLDRQHCLKCVCVCVCVYKCGLARLPMARLLHFVIQCSCVGLHSNAMMSCTWSGGCFESSLQQLNGQ